MSNYKAAIERDGCKHSCNTSKICVCAMIEDADDEIKRLREALRALIIAVEYKGPPVDFGEGNLCWEARVPVAFVDIARAALGEGK